MRSVLIPLTNWWFKSTPVPMLSIYDKLAKDCDVKGFKVIAMLLRNGHCIMQEVNRWSSNGRVSNWTEHAEERLVRKMWRTRVVERFRGKLSVLVLRVSASGLRMAHPCRRCMLLLQMAGIRSIQFSNREGRIEWLK